MSWYVQAVAKSKEAVIAEVEKNQHIPPELKIAIQAQVKALATTEMGAIVLQTSGHLDMSGGQAEFKLSQMKILE